MKHYLDYNATAPVRPEALEVMQELQPLALNPSSMHALGRKAKHILDDSRRKIAETVGAFTNEVIFTASGTEANNWIVRGFPHHKILISAIEHSSLLKTADLVKGSVTVPVTGDGVVNLAALEKLLPLEEPFLVSVMLANNETGVIQPIRQIADLVHAMGGILHCDAVQAFGKIPIDFTALGCDLMTISGHKMGGPVGAAALIAKNTLPLQPMLTGGGQEQRLRAGTENVVAIAGFAKASGLIDFAHMHRIREWLDKLEEEIVNLAWIREGTIATPSLEGISVNDLPARNRNGFVSAEAGRGDTPPPSNKKFGGSSSRIIGKSSSRLPNTSCMTMPSVTSETQIIGFDLEGIAVSAGSACSSGKIESSHVLKAMGLDDKKTATAIRISGGWATTEEDITAAAEAWKKLFLRKREAAA